MNWENNKGTWKYYSQRYFILNVTFFYIFFLSKKLNFSISGLYVSLDIPGSTVIYSAGGANSSQRDCRVESSATILNEWSRPFTDYDDSSSGEVGVTFY